mgnify:CR=1 FL=1
MVIELGRKIRAPEGEEEGVLLSSSGEAQAGFGASRLDVPVAQVFSAATAPDGSVWLGTGDQADLYVWDGGKEAKKACHLEGVLVSALAAAPDGTIYAGTLPGGRLWEVKGGAAKPLDRDVVFIRDEFGVRRASAGRSQASREDEIFDADGYPRQRTDGLTPCDSTIHVSRGAQSAFCV